MRNRDPQNFDIPLIICYFLRLYKND